MVSHFQICLLVKMFTFYFFYIFYPFFITLCSVIVIVRKFHHLFKKFVDYFLQICSSYDHSFIKDPSIEFNHKAIQKYGKLAPLPFIWLVFRCWKFDVCFFVQCDYISNDYSKKLNSNLIIFDLSCVWWPIVCMWITW